MRATICGRSAVDNGVAEAWVCQAVAPYRAKTLGKPFACADAIVPSATLAATVEAMKRRLTLRIA